MQNHAICPQPPDLGYYTMDTILYPGIIYCRNVQTPKRNPNIGRLRKYDPFLASSNVNTITYYNITITLYENVCIFPSSLAMLQYYTAMFSDLSTPVFSPGCRVWKSSRQQCKSEKRAKFVAPHPSFRSAQMVSTCFNPNHQGSSEKQQGSYQKA